MALPASESFNVANNVSLPAAISNWTQVTSVGNLGINTNACYPNAASDESACYWNADAPGDNQYAQVTFIAGAGGGINVGPAVRVATGAASYYGVYFNNVAETQFFKNVADTWTQFGSNTASPGVNAVVRIEANGTTIRWLDDGVEQASVTDSAHVGGRLGVCGFGSNTGCRMDDWSGGNVTEPVEPTFIGAGTAAFTATASATVTPGLPTGWAADDIHVLMAHGSNNLDWPEPSGWTKISPSAAAEDNTAAQRVEVWVRRAVGGDTAPVLSTYGGTTVRGAQIYGIRGCSTSGTAADQISAMSRSNNAASATVTYATITPPDPNTRLLAVYAYEDDPTAGSTISGFGGTTVATSALGNDMALGHSTRTWPSADSATGALTQTVSGGTFANSVNVGVLLSFKPPGAATPELLGRPFGLGGGRQMTQLLAQ